MQIIETKIYTYNELSDKAEEKARDWFRESSAGDEFGADCVFEDAADIADMLGIDIRQTRIKRLADYKGAPEYKPTIYYSGFSSQGDGACFEGTWRAKDVKLGKVQDHAPTDVELHRIAAEFERLALLCPDGRFSVKHRGHYYHKYCTDFEFDNLIPEYDDDTARSTAEWAAIEAKYKSVEDDLKESARDFMEWIYRQLEKEYDYQNSDEVVAENIVANEYEFTVDGVRA